MSNTDVYKELTNQDVALKDGDKVVGVPYVMETYGLIYNKDILNKYFALDGAKATSMDEIDNFDTLKAVADDMQSRKDEAWHQGRVHLRRLRLQLRLAIQDPSGQPAALL